MIDLNVTAQLASLPGVGSSAWFGVFVPPTETGLWVLRIMMLVCLFSLYQCVRVLIEEYRERKECRRQYGQYPRQPHGAMMNTLKTKRVVGGDFRQLAEQECECKHNLVRRGCLRIGATNGFQVLERFVYVVLRCFHTPNDPSSATGKIETQPCEKK